MAISRPDFWSLITKLFTRNPNLGIPPLEDGLFANLWICYYLFYIFVFGKGKGKEKGREKEKGKGKGKGKGTEKGKGILKIARVPSCEVGSTVVRNHTVSSFILPY